MAFGFQIAVKALRASTYVYSSAAISAGAINIAWGDFATDWQPIQAFTLSGIIPFRHAFAYLTALALVAGGVAMLNRRSARSAATTLAITYAIFAVFWLPRFYWVAHFFGFRLTMVLGVLDGVGQQLILVSGAVLALAMMASPGRALEKTAKIASFIFGAFAIIFGVVHFTSPFSSVAALVPKWLPPNQLFWAHFTGAAFILAGIAILSGICDILAARLLTAMLAVFSALVLVPQIFSSPGDHSAWGGNAYNLGAVGAAWILADYLVHRRRISPLPSSP